MRKNLLPRIVIAVVLVLFALHFLISNVSVTHEGETWKDPKFSFSYSGPGSSKTEHSSGSANDRPSTLWNNLWPGSSKSQNTTNLSWQDAANAALGSETSAAPALPDPSPASTVSEETSQTIAAAPSGISHGAMIIPSALPEHNATHDVHATHGNETKLPCSELEGASDVVFIIKTGATEVDEKIPVHFNTTLRCFPNYLLFSDFGENYQGHTIYDALGEIVDQVRLDNDDFDLWRRLHEKGREGLAANELSINDHTDPNGGSGNPDNGGWRLDKFKNIPMVNYTIHKYPDAKWFIYTDADTYIVWSNFLKWIRQMDSTGLYYLGSAAMIDDQIFGHGGSGYIISNALMKKAAEVYNEEQGKWDQYAAGHWAGDCVLATLLEDIGGPLTWSYPSIQGGDPMVMDFWETGYDRRLWCYPAVSYHHIKPSTVASLWHLEQEWLANGSTKDMHHSDVYKQWYLPQLSPIREGWDNLSEDEVNDVRVKDAWACRDHCQAHDDCFQWSFQDNMCRTFGTTRLGRPNEDSQAGWMIDRIHEKIIELDHCEEGDWITPDYKRVRRMEPVERHELARLAAHKYR